MMRAKCARTVVVVVVEGGGVAKEEGVVLEVEVEERGGDQGEGLVVVLVDGTKVKGGEVAVVEVAAVVESEVDYFCAGISLGHDFTKQNHASTG